MEENKRIMKFGYEDTDQKIEIEIYGLVFEIRNLDKRNIEKIRNVDKNLDSVEREIEEILGKGSVIKINEKRKKDGYEDMSLDVELAILGCIFETYANATTNNMIDKVTNTVKNINDRMNNLNKRNRKQRRGSK